MKDIKDIVISASIFLIATSVFYYLVIFKPSIERADIIGRDFKQVVLCNGTEQISKFDAWQFYCEALGIETKDVQETVDN